MSDTEDIDIDEFELDIDEEIDESQAESNLDEESKSDSLFSANAFKTEIPTQAKHKARKLIEGHIQAFTDPRFENTLNKYHVAALLGKRATMLERGAPSTLSEEECRKLITSKNIAREEFKQNKLPLKIKLRTGNVEIRLVDTANYPAIPEA